MPVSEVRCKGSKWGIGMGIIRFVDPATGKFKHEASI